MVPSQIPIGLQLTRVAREVSRAFDNALEDAGGSLPMWLVLLNLKINPRASQRELAEAVGVREATITHHLNAMEKDGLLTRRRDPANRRIHIVETSNAGNALFLRLRDTAAGFDRQLRQGLDEAGLAKLRELLGCLAGNVGGDTGGPPWAGLTKGQPAS
ncbi:MAG TPA: MarR family winged helix-turn-helix transcriptional regulator [Streptosporangiaceae bacterium]|jgi:MarR family transcriptional regulator, transcriptional regulator for hemolysin|nr:MarR family winged helix-turn-helix transcriptional regulator [Streptosporangiaceae bacterium]